MNVGFVLHFSCIALIFYEEASWLEPDCNKILRTHHRQGRRPRLEPPRVLIN